MILFAGAWFGFMAGLVFGVLVARMSDETETETIETAIEAAE